ncbi:MAG TPA: methyltransferase domain-containing protein, partial [Bryobacteraceae bacterium]|nr:methyltransferase domain-containing protein [Bryobacteraceae bacterium]
AKANGLTVRRAMIEDDSAQPRSVDAVFVWNCFEQLQNPGPALEAIHRTLRRHGLLVIRVPNALFYRRRRSDTAALAWNNLLGFPYLYGYTADHVSRLARRWGFEYVRGFDSELVTMPFPDRTARIAEEQKSISEQVGAWSIATTARSGRLTGPWIEMVYRKIDGPAPLHRTPPDLHFLPRAA